MKYLLVLTTFLLGACTQFGAFVANVPSHLNDLPVTTDIEFGDHPLHTLDVYGTKPDHAPVIVFIYGGRWQMGNKEMYRFVGDRFAKLGYVVVIPDYQKYPDVKYPTFAQDGAAAVQWTFDHIAQYGGDPSRVILMGHSAGAHTAAILAANESYGVQNKMKGFVGLAGPYDFVPEAKDVIDIFSPVTTDQMQVTTFIDGTEAPMFLLHGGQDEVVNVTNLEKLKRGIKDQNGRVETKIYPELDHVDMVKVMTWIYRDKATVVDDIDAFIKTTLQ